MVNQLFGNAFFVVLDPRLQAACATCMPGYHAAMTAASACTRFGRRHQCTVQKAARTVSSTAVICIGCSMRDLQQARAASRLEAALTIQAPDRDWNSAAICSIYRDFDAIWLAITSSGLRYCTSEHLVYALPGTWHCFVTLNMWAVRSIIFTRIINRDRNHSHEIVLWTLIASRGVTSLVGILHKKSM